MFFGAGSKYEGFGLRFFETRIRTYITSGSIGILVTFVCIVLVPEDFLYFLLSVALGLLVLIITTYFSQGMRESIESEQSKGRIPGQSDIHNEDSISQH
jgi:hypothetical protein